MDQNEYDAQMLNEDHEGYKKILHRHRMREPESIDKTFERFIDAFKQVGMEVTVFPDNLIEFHGTVSDNDEKPCQVVGSFELSADRTYSASALWYTATAETDGERFSGSLDDPTNTVESIVASIIYPGISMDDLSVTKNDVMIQLQRLLAELGRVTFSDGDLIEVDCELQDTAGLLVRCQAEYDVFPDLSVTVTASYTYEDGTSTGLIHQSLHWEGDAYYYVKALIPTFTKQEVMDGR